MLALTRLKGIELQDYLFSPSEKGIGLLQSGFENDTVKTFLENSFDYNLDCHRTLKYLHA